MSRKNHNPISWVPTVYFAMGLPFVVLNMVSVLMFKGLGIGDAQIALWTSLIMMPWTLKFLWSPFLEMFKTKKFFVVLTQMVTGAGFALVALALQLPVFFAVCIALLAVIAFSGATHDVATDGVYMSELSKQDQAKYIGWQGAFYNIAKIVASGGLVGRCFVGRLRWSGGCHRGSPLRSYPACMDDGDADIGGGDAAAWLLSHTHVAVGRCGRIRCQVGKGDVGAVGGGNQGFLLEEAHLVLYSVHYPLSPCRGLCHEDCPPFPEGGAFGRRLGTE